MDIDRGRHREAFFHWKKVGSSRSRNWEGKNGEMTSEKEEEKRGAVKVKEMGKPTRKRLGGEEKGGDESEIRWRCEMSE